MATLKADWQPLELCPGGCGKPHRRCCDSVIGEPHQTRCTVLGPFPEAPAQPTLWRLLAKVAAFVNRL